MQDTHGIIGKVPLNHKKRSQLDSIFGVLSSAVVLICVEKD